MIGNEQEESLIVPQILIDMGHEIIANTRHEQDSFQRQAIEANHVFLALALDHYHYGLYDHVLSFLLSSTKLRS